MFDLDWLALCRRVVREHRSIFEQIGSIEERTVYEGRGEGGDQTLVIDRLCEDVIFAELEALSADGHSFGVVSEERGEVIYGDSPAAWVVIDPIDGSLNARRTIPSHSLSVAVASGTGMDSAEFGYVYDFGAGEEFWAVRGEGAWLDGARLVAHDPARPASRRAMEIVGLESADPEIATGPIAALADHAHRLRVVGSIAITACQVAAGRFDGMFSLRPCRSVDAAAAQLIVREAGGFVALGRDGLEAAGFSLDQRYPIAAGGTEGNLGLLVAAQDVSPALSRG